MFWKKNRVIDEFAHRQANDFFSQVQPEAAQAFLDFEETANAGGKKRGGEHHLPRKQLEQSINRFAQFKLDNSLGIYGKARFHMKFRSRLVELGYPENLADEIDRVLMLNTP